MVPFLIIKSNFCFPALDAALLRSYKTKKGSRAMPVSGSYLYFLEAIFLAIIIFPKLKNFVF